MLKIASFFLMIFLLKCTQMPSNLKPVKGFEVDRYLGKWYEIARLDHRFERGLNNITAEYTLGTNGAIMVHNKGFNIKKGVWKDAKGKAFLLGDPSEGRLKVSFFGPFYASYNIIALDQENYSYALVCGPDREYLWILAREPKMELKDLESLLSKARTWGFETDKLIFVVHSKEPPTTKILGDYNPGSITLGSYDLPL